MWASIRRGLGRRVFVVAVVGGLGSSAAAQSVAERTPNLSGGWTAAPGVVQFNFIHRFEVSDPPQRKLTNYPTFFVGTGVTPWAMVGVAYGPNSELTPNFPNEYEFFVRARPVRLGGRFPADLAAQLAYNVSTETTDAELQLGWSLGPLRLLGVGRSFVHPDSTRWAVGGGAVLRLTRSLALAGDWTTLLARRPGERTAWGAGLQIGVPYTPHSVSVQVTNVNTGTLGGSSRGTRSRVGFEYTVPITIGRYARRQSRSSAPPTTMPMMDGDTVRIRIKDLKFDEADIVVAPGTVVEWVNDDPLVHTATDDAAGFDSGNIEPGARWAFTFTEVGSYEYRCSPHPFMRGRVTVQAMSRGGN